MKYEVKVTVYQFLHVCMESILRYYSDYQIRIIVFWQYAVYQRVHFSRDFDFERNNNIFLTSSKKKKVSSIKMNILEGDQKQKELAASLSSAWGVLGGL